MRQLFNRTRVLLPLLALLAVPATSFGQSGRSWSEKYDTIPDSIMDDGNPAWWNSIFGADLCCSTVLQDWKAMSADTEKWHTNEDCKAAMGYTRDALASADIQIGSGTANLAGEYFGDEDVIVVAMSVALGGGGFGTLIHEAWHRSTGQDDDDIKALNARLGEDHDGRTLESCHDEAREEDEDDPGGGDPGTTETCEDVEVPPLTTTVPVWIPPGNCPGQPEAEECDWDTGPTLCTGMVVRVCPGRWVDQIVVLREGYTERVCTSN